MFQQQIGIDLGTSTIIIYVRGKGIIYQAPSIVTISPNNAVGEVGHEALAMLGRVPESFEVVRPLKDGVIADYRAAEGMLRYYMKRLGVERPVWSFLPFFGPEVMISVPVGITSVEKRAVKDAANKAARRTVHTIHEPLAAAIGAGLPIHTPTGNMILDMGGGTSEAAVISMSGIVTSRSIRVAGMKFDDAIASYVRRKHNLVIGEQTAEEIKITIGSATLMEKKLAMEVKGRDQLTGLPSTIHVTSDEVTEALTERLSEISAMVKTVLEQTPPELASDIIDRGIIITGGSAELRNIDIYLTKHTGVPCYVADNPRANVAKGACDGLTMRAALERAAPPDSY